VYRGRWDGQHTWLRSGGLGVDIEQVRVLVLDEPPRHHRRRLNVDAVLPLLDREDRDLLLVVAFRALPRDDAVLPGVPGAHHELAVEAAFRQRAAFVVAGVADRAEPTVMVKNGDRPAVELEDGGDLEEERGLVAEAVPRGHGTHPLGAV